VNRGAGDTASYVQISNLITDRSRIALVQVHHGCKLKACILEMVKDRSRRLHAADQGSLDQGGATALPPSMPLDYIFETLQSRTSLIEALRGCFLKASEFRDITLKCPMEIGGLRTERKHMKKVYQHTLAHR